MKRVRIVTLAAVAAISLTSAACGSSSKTSTAPAATSAGSSGTAASGPIQNVSVMVGGLSKQIYLPFQLAAQLGYYKQFGLNVTLTDEPAGVDATTQMLAGQVNGTGGFYDHTLAIQGLGKSAESVVSMLQVPGEVELCRTDLKGKINSPADWKGQSLGVTDLGSSTDFLTQYLAVKNGLQTSDIHRLGVQAGPTLVAAMQHKSVACAMTTEPTVSQLLSTNQAYILEDMRTAAGAAKALGGTYPATSLYMQTSYVNSHPQIVQKLVNAYVKTLGWIQAHSGMDVANIMPADYSAGVGKAAYAQAFDNEKGIYNPTGLMPSDGPQTVLNVQNAFNPDVKGKAIDLSKTYTDTFVQAAIKSGV